MKRDFVWELKVKYTGAVPLEPGIFSVSRLAQK
jgi:hypothetical protein